MSVHFITILGTSLYTDCTYEIEGTDFMYRTPFAQMAALKYVISQCGRCDRITVFLTEKSREKNWLTRQYTDTERHILAGRRMELKPHEQKIGLKEMMETEFSETAIESVKIREGRNKEEINEIFEAMYDAILPEETIYFDFTHGLRNIPMQALTVIHYAKVLKNIQVGGMYYGAFELGRQQEDGSLHVNLLDMSACSTILDWTNAAESFIKGGSSSQIQALYNQQVKPGKEEKYSTNVLRRLCDLTNCLNTSRGKAAKEAKASIRKSYEYYKLNYDEMRKSEHQISEKPLVRLFDKIEEDVGIFGEKCYVLKDGRKIYLDNTATGMAAVLWAIRKGLTQQGFTALEETIKTYICEAYEIPAQEELYRDVIVGNTVKFMSAQYNGVKKEQTKLVKQERVLPDIEVLKSVRRRELEEDLRFMKLEEQERKFYLQHVEGIMDNMTMELVNLTSDVTKFRNSLNHFGFQKTDISYIKLQGTLLQLYETMREIMEKETVTWE